MNRDLYFYPAIITKLGDKDYNIKFPDIEEIVSYGESLNDAYTMAEDALKLYLFDAYEDKEEIKEPSDIEGIKLEDKQTLIIVRVSLIEAIKQYDDKAVKKTLTIPNWLNKLAEENKVNFSKTLKDALVKQLIDKV